MWLRHKCIKPEADVVQILKQNKSHGFEVMHLKEITKTNHVQLKSRISRHYSKCVTKVGDSSHFSS